MVLRDLSTLGEWGMSLEHVLQCRELTVVTFGDSGQRDVLVLNRTVTSNIDFVKYLRVVFSNFDCNKQIHRKPSKTMRMVMLMSEKVTYLTYKT